MNTFFAVFVALAVLALASVTEAAVYIGGGCYDCNPPGGQGPGIYTANGGRGSPGNGGGRPAYSGGGYGGALNRGNDAGRPVYSGNFGPNGYSGGGVGGGFGGAPNRGGNGGRRGGGVKLHQSDDGAQSIIF